MLYYHVQYFTILKKISLFHQVEAILFNHFVKSPIKKMYVTSPSVTIMFPYKSSNYGPRIVLVIGVVELEFLEFIILKILTNLHSNVL